MDALSQIQSGIIPPPLALSVVRTDATTTAVLFHLRRFEHPLLSGILVTHSDLSGSGSVGREFLRIQAQLETIVRMLPLIALVVDEALTIVDILTTRRDARGLTGSEHAGSKLAELFPDPITTRLEQLIGQAWQDTEEHTCEYELDLAGDQRWFEARARALPGRHTLIIILDATERRRAFEVVRKNEARYRAVVNALPDAVCRWLPDLTLTFANNSYCRLFGPHDTLLGRRWTSFLPADEAAAIEEKYLHLVSAPRPVTYQHSVIDTNGDERILVWNETPIFGTDGHLVEYQSIGRDITAERRMQDELARRDSMLHSIISAIPNPVFYKNLAGEYLGCNPAFAELVSLAEPTVLGKTVTEITNHGLAERLLESDAVILSGQDHDSFQVDVMTADGVLRRAMVNKAAFYDEQGGLAGIVGVVTDISERLAIEQYQTDTTAYLTILSSLRASGREAGDFPRLLEEICTGFTMLSGVWFQARADLLVATAEAGAACQRVTFIGMESSPGRGLTGEAVRSRTPQLCPDLGLLDEDCAWQHAAITGGIRTALAISSRVDEELSGCYLFLASRPEDLSESRINHLRLLIDELIRITQEDSWRKRVSRQETHLQAQLMQAQKLESIGIMAGGVAHEINNPLTGIINYAQLIQDRMPEGCETLRTYSAEIIAEGERISRIVRSLLAFSRQEHTPARPYQVSEIISRISLLCSKILEKSEIRLDVDISPGLPPILCRGEEIAQVLLNLIINARDALNDRFPEWSPEKHVLVSCTLHPARDGWVRLAVRDWGGGIPDEVHDRVFDPFFSTKTRETGTGLGLSVSYGIIQAHHGSLSFTTNPGEGTVFTIDLPCGPRAS